MNSDADNLDIDSSVKKHILTLLDQISKYKKHSAIIIEQKDAQIARLTDAVDKRDALITELAAKTSRLVNEKNSALIGLELTLQARDTEIKMMRSTIVFQIASRYQSVVNKVFPASSGTRRLYELVMSGFRVILNKGWMVFFREADKNLSKKKPSTDNAVSGSLQLIENGGKHLDIIIPVYNAFEHVQKCISSVLSCTSEIPFTIVIVDDCSTDNRLKEYLSYLVAKHASIKVLRNEKNAGYLKSVNLGMKYSRNDVVLLNSDTVVTHGWLRKLQDCAYSNDHIATVTPLSNNATICSVPEFCANNDIPSGYDIQEYAALIQKSVTSLGIKCYEIPVGVGFCIYVKREVIQKIGLFDTKFDKGYEEEVDFCLKARQKGYYNVVCTQAFVYHAGNVSFQDSRSELETKNWQLLVKKHPYYPDFIHDFVENNPLKPVQIAIGESIDKDRVNGDNINIGVDAQLLLRPQWTGTEKYIFKLIENLLDRGLNAHEYLTVFSSNKDLDKYHTCDRFKRKFASDSTDILWDPDFYKCDIFHRTFQCYSVYDLLLLLNARRGVITIHDLIAYRHPEYFENSEQFKNYQNIARLSAKYADRIIAVSKFGREDISETLNIPLEKIEVSYQPIPIINGSQKEITDWMVQEFRNKYGIKKPYILYVSALFPHKNHENLIKAYKNIHDELDKPVDLFIVGPDTHLAGYKAKLENLVYECGDRVKFFNYVSNEDMPLFYKGADLFVFPSLDEGFGIPPLEAMYYGTPVVCSRAASMPEVAGDGALMVDCMDVAELSKAIKDIITDKILREELINKGKVRVHSFIDEIASIDRANVYRKMMNNPDLDSEKSRITDYDRELESVAINQQEYSFLRNKWIGNRKY